MNKNRITTYGKIGILITIFLTIVISIQLIYSEETRSELNIIDGYMWIVESQIKNGTENWTNNTINSELDNITESVLVDQ